MWGHIRLADRRGSLRGPNGPVQDLALQMLLVDEERRDGREAFARLKHALVSAKPDLAPELFPDYFPEPEVEVDEDEGVDYRLRLPAAVERDEVDAWIDRHELQGATLGDAGEWV
jgi:hypothetical protein